MTAELRFSKAKSVFKGFVAFAACAMCVAIAYVAFRQGRGLKALPLAIAFPIAAWGVIRSIKRFLERGPALACDARELRLSQTLNRTPRIGYRDIERIDCDRADRVGYVGGPLGSAGPATADWHIGDGERATRRWAGRVGASLRWAFQIVYRDANGTRRGIRLFDNDVEGGREALLRFAAAVRARLDSERPQV